MGYSQAVRHRTLTPSFAGSNPASPVHIFFKKTLNSFGFSVFAFKIFISFFLVLLNKEPLLCNVDTDKKKKTATTNNKYIYLPLLPFTYKVIQKEDII
jgi:hypothetical protein